MKLLNKLKQFTVLTLASVGPRIQISHEELKRAYRAQRHEHEAAVARIRNQKEVTQNVNRSIAIGF